MKVLAFDPGYDRLGVAIVERKDGNDTLIYSTCLTTNKKAALSERIFSLGQSLDVLFKKEQPTHVALETLFFNKNVKTAIGVAEARGMLLYLASVHSCIINEYSPQQIKVAVTGYGNSDKMAVFSMIKRLIKNVPETGHDDEYDAIAVGITCLAHNSATR